MTDPKTNPTQLTWLQMFTRSQVSAFTASAVDFGVIFALTEALGVWYVVSTALGTLLGGITSFLMNRHWGFDAGQGEWRGQAFRHFVSSGLSMLLNTWGVYAVTEYFGLHYALSVILVALTVGIAVNFPLQRYWVFHLPRST